MLKTVYIFKKYIVLSILLGVCYTYSCCVNAEDVSFNNSKMWLTRSYYSSDNELLTIEERNLNEDGVIIKESFSSVSGVPQGTYTKFDVDESGCWISGTVYFEDDTPSGTVITYLYDAQKYLIKAVWTIGEEEQTVAYKYDDYGQLISKEITSENGDIILIQKIQNTYNEAGCLIKSITISEDGTFEKMQISEYAYDEMGYLVKETLFDEKGVLNGYYEFSY